MQQKIFEMLKSAGIEAARFEAKEIVKTAKTESEAIEFANRRISGEPLQYILGEWEFYGLPFYVGEGVLIPRADTETLVDAALEIIGDKPLRVADLCSGSGAIAISLAKYTENNKIYAADISSKALEVAKKNAIKNGVDEKIEFINSNMFENVNDNEKFDVIVSNPPYIESEVVLTLDKQVQHEPKIALDGGADGLDFYRELLESSKKYLKENGIIAMEIGYNQKEAVTNLFKTEYKNVYCKKDLAGNDRVIVCRNFI